MRSNLQRWERRLGEMKRCNSIAELVQKYGDAPHKVPQDGFEIWHYPLGAEAGMLYSIHVSVWPDQSSQIYMHLEPINIPDTAPGLPWWKFWKRRI
jgi:hypothetical protein